MTKAIDNSRKITVRMAKTEIKARPTNKLAAEWTTMESALDKELEAEFDKHFIKMVLELPRIAGGHWVADPIDDSVKLISKQTGIASREQCMDILKEIIIQECNTCAFDELDVGAVIDILKKFRV